MPWRVDKGGAQIAASWKDKDKDGKITAYQANWNDFMNAVNRGQHPAKAGEHMTYKMLNKSTGQAQIKLSGDQRASFIVDEKNEVINKIQLGGHT